MTNNLNYNFLTVISVIAILCGILVIISKNPIVSVLFLIGLFITIAIYLMMLGINFIGLSYLLVYVGAVSILFLFILMLINVRISELVTNNSNSIPLAIIISIFVALNQLFPKTVGMPIMMIGGIDSFLLYKRNEGTNTSTNNGTSALQEGVVDSEVNYTYVNYYLNELLQVTSNSWDTRLSETSHITTIGNVIYTNYPLWLILTSIILLLAMIGSILITIKQ
jgi:NADH-ubiquinone oxidoreductase chain 6